jgi:serine/threonine protein phosphatase PrpC
MGEHDGDNQHHPEKGKWWENGRPSVKPERPHKPRLTLKYEAFLAQQTPIVVRGIKTDDDIEKVIVPHTKQDFTIEERKGTVLPVTILTANEKGHDAIGLSMGHDGKLGIAVADGVTNCATPVGASQTLVAASLDAMDKGDLSSRTLSDASDAFHTVGWEHTAREYAQRMRDDTYRMRLKQYIDEDRIAASTLALGQYNPDTGDVQVVIGGDSGAAVIRHGGGIERYEGNNDHILNYHPDPDWQYDPAGAMVARLKLQKGDIMLFYSDGLREDIFEEIKEKVVKGNEDSNRLDKKIAIFIRERMKTAGVGDDVSVVALHHNPEKVKPWWGGETPNRVNAQ